MPGFFHCAAIFRSVDARCRHLFAIGIRPQGLEPDLFGAAPSRLPDGMLYQGEFLSREEEHALIQLAAALPLKEMNCHGYQARRRVASYGGRYDFEASRLKAASPVPVELQPLRGRVALWLGVAPEDLTQMLVAEYSTGTPLGWHRDVPDFEDVVGVSLPGDVVMRFRPYPPRAPRKADILKLVVAARSIYLLRGPARWAWQHSVAPAASLRYSITFRTARGRG